MKKAFTVIVIGIVALAMIGLALGGALSMPAAAPVVNQPTTTQPNSNGSATSTPTSTVAATTTVRVALPGGRCGGNMQNAPVCGAGYQCAPEPGSRLPFGDVGGICVKK